MKSFNHLLLIFLVVGFSCKDHVVETVGSIYTTWEITDYFSVESSVYTKDENSKILISFEKDGFYALQLDVNSCQGSFSVSDNDKMEITAPGCTKMCCDSNFSNKVTSMLPRVKSYTLEKNKLKLNVPEWGWLILETGFAEKV